jgi:signal transduction histidine kinase
LAALNIESTDLVRLVHEVVQEYGNELAPVHVRAPEELQAQLDTDRIRSAIDALVRNALRRSPGSLPVVIDIGVVQQDGADQVVVSVQDEGTSIGVAPLPGLGMVPISPADSSSFGLSLYQARSAVEDHGGTNTVDTPSINTAVFKLFLPLTSRVDSPAG